MSSSRQIAGCSRPEVHAPRRQCLRWAAVCAAPNLVTTRIANAASAGVTPGAVSRAVDIQAHRGARWHVAENTLEGFELALRMGARTLELDIVVSRDDELLISHDPALNPDITRDAQGRFLSARGPDIYSMSWQEVQAYDVGRIRPWSRYAQSFPEQQGRDGLRIPRLKDLFARVKTLGREDVRYAIETKITPHSPHQTPDPERFVDLLMAQVEQAGVRDRVQVLSFDWRTLMVLRRRFSDVPRVFVTAQLSVLDNLQLRSDQPSPWAGGLRYRDYGSVPRMLAAGGATHWSSFWQELSPALVREAQSLGLQVLAWTVNERDVMHRLLDWGVDGIVTDRPDLGVQVLRERGISLA
jgi:glycerophosphoryl diester phosphodiesterase